LGKINRLGFSLARLLGPTPLDRSVIGSCLYAFNREGCCLKFLRSTRAHWQSKSRDIAGLSRLLSLFVGAETKLSMYGEIPLELVLCGHRLRQTGAFGIYARIGQRRPRFGELVDVPSEVTEIAFSNKPALEDVLIFCSSHRVRLRYIVERVQVGWNGA